MLLPVNISLLDCIDENPNFTESGPFWEEITFNPMRLNSAILLGSAEAAMISVMVPASGWQVLMKWFGFQSGANIREDFAWNTLAYHYLLVQKTLEMQL